MARKPMNVGQEHLDVSERLSMPYARVLIPEAGGGYRAEILEFPGCIALGDDAAEALSALETTAEDWLEAAMEMGSPIPAPFEETDFSGKLGLRLPKSLHRKATLAAERDGVSLNQFIVASIAEYVGQKSQEKVRTHLFVHDFKFVPTMQERHASSLSGPLLVTSTNLQLTNAISLQGTEYAHG